MMLLRLITWPYIRRHRLRTLLTTVGIVLGVAVFVGMHTANESVLFAFYRTIDRIAGKAELQITAGEGGFPEDVLERGVEMLGFLEKRWSVLLGSRAEKIELLRLEFLELKPIPAQPA